MSYQTEVEKRRRLLKESQAELDALQASGASAGKIRAKNEELEWHKNVLSGIEESAALQAANTPGEARKKNTKGAAIRDVIDRAGGREALFEMTQAGRRDAINALINPRFRLAREADEHKIKAFDQAILDELKKPR
jgi:hypothetical protein